MFRADRGVFVYQDDPALGGLPAPGEAVFYPKVGHCVFRGVTEDRAAPGKKLVELEDLEEGSRILIPTERVPKLGLRPAGRSLEDIQQELSSEFEQPSEDEGELDGLLEDLVNDGSPRNLAKGLKRLHLLRQTTGLSREEEQIRRKIRSWLAAEVAISKDCSRAEAQALLTRILQEAMNAHRLKEREEAKERRRQVKAQRAADDAALKVAEEAEAEAAEAARLELFAAVDQGQAETEPVDEGEPPPAPLAGPEPVEPVSEEHDAAAGEATPSPDAEPSTDDTPPRAEPSLEEPPEEKSVEQESKPEPAEAAAPKTFEDPSETPSDSPNGNSNTRNQKPAESS